MARKKALIVKLGQIGDVIMAIPGVRELHVRDYDIDWICGKTVAPLLACYSWIRPIPIDDRQMLAGSWGQRMLAIGSLWGKVGFQGYDLCVTLYYDRRYRILTVPVRAKRSKMLSERSRATMLLPGRHHTDEYARILLGEEDTYREQRLAPVVPDRLSGAPLAERLGERRVAIVPGGVNPLVRERASGRIPAQALRRWPIERYVTLTREMVSRGWEVVLLGGPEDSWVRPYFESMGVIDSIGKLSLADVVTACNGCDAVVTHDTGPLHLAGLSRASIVGIFGPTDPAMRLPQRSGVVGIWGGRDLPCRPCYDGRDFAPCHFNGCMQEVSVEQVLGEIDKLLPKSPGNLAVPGASTAER